MAKYIDTVKVGSTPTSVILSERGAAAPFSWNLVLPESDPLHSIVAEPPEKREERSALPGAAVKKRRSKG
jgi:hypothetical protein